MEAPVQAKPQRLGDYLQVLTKAVFQSGISWKVVEAKWDGFREVFGDFNPARLSEFTTADVDRIVQDKRIIRNRRKIEATVENAAVMLDLDRQFHGFENYLRSHSGYEAMSQDLIKRFKFLGKASVYFFLWGVGEPVPAHDEALGVQASGEATGRLKTSPA